MVNKEAVAAWVAALRSGEFEQTRETLVEVVGNEQYDLGLRFCCLGVACEVAMARGVPIRRSGSRYLYQLESGCELCAGRGCSFCELEEQEEGELPPPVLEWFGFNEPSVELMLDGKHTNAAYLNDELYYDFRRIADVVEENYLDGEEGHGAESGASSAVD